MRPPAIEIRALYPRIPEWPMARRLAVIALMLCVLAATLSTSATAQVRRRERTSPAAPTAAPAAMGEPTDGYAAYRMVRLRNIFDPDRKPLPVEGAAKPTAVIQPPARPPVLSLTGTIVAENKKLAFFTGSQSEFNRVVAVQGRIGDFTVTNIASAYVDLRRGEEVFVLPVGKQLNLGAKATIESSTSTTLPTMAPAEALPASTGPSTATAPSPSAPGAPGASTPAPSNDPKEVMRRMMERRLKENK